MAIELEAYSRPIFAIAKSAQFCGRSVGASSLRDSRIASISATVETGRGSCRGLISDVVSSWISASFSSVLFLDLLSEGFDCHCLHPNKLGVFR